jgi:hypothetical protein
MSSRGQTAKLVSKIAKAERKFTLCSLSCMQMSSLASQLQVSEPPFSRLVTVRRLIERGGGGARGLVACWACSWCAPSSNMACRGCSHFGPRGNRCLFLSRHCSDDQPLHFKPVS